MVDVLFLFLNIITPFDDDINSKNGDLISKKLHFCIETITSKMNQTLKFVIT